MGSKMINFDPPFDDTINSPADNDFDETPESQSTVYREVHNAVYSVQSSPVLNTPTNHVETVKQEKKHYIRIQCMRLLVAFTCGVVVAVVIVVPTVYFTTRNKTSHSVSYRFPLKFDQDRHHSNVYMSNDGLKLSNVYSKETPIAPHRSDGPLSQYKGVIADRCISASEKVYFEISYRFHAINSDRTTSLLLFEVGVANRDKIDNSHYVGASGVGGGSYYLNYCNISVCLAAVHKEKHEFTPITMHHSIITGREYKDTFGFVVNRVRKEFIIIYETVVIHTFRLVTIDSELCLAFGVYNSHHVDLQIALTNTYDFSTLPFSVVAM